MDIDRQSSMLTLLQTLQLEFGTAILYLSVDATSVQLMVRARLGVRVGVTVRVRVRVRARLPPR